MATLLTKNLRESFTRVEASHGMAGVDGITIREFEDELAFNLGVLDRESAGKKKMASRQIGRSRQKSDDSWQIRSRLVKTK